MTLGLHGEPGQGGSRRLRRRPGLLRQLVAAPPADLHAARLLSRGGRASRASTCDSTASPPTPASRCRSPPSASWATPTSASRPCATRPATWSCSAVRCCADPDWPLKAYAGRIDEIVPCIGDQEGCVNEFVEGGHPQCAVNPRTGFEDVFAPDLPAVAQPRRVAVVGAGPSGIACACAAARRGHRVTRVRAPGPAGRHAGARLGAARQARRRQLPALPRRARCERTARQHDLELRLGSRGVGRAARAGGLRHGRDLHRRRARGGPRSRASTARSVVSAVDLLRRPALAAGARQVVVVGGGAVGCEVAFWLAAEHDKQVTVVEMLPQFMTGNCTANRGYLLHYLEARGVKLLNCARLRSVDDSGRDGRAQRLAHGARPLRHLGAAAAGQRQEPSRPRARAWSTSQETHRRRRWSCWPPVSRRPRAFTRSASGVTSRPRCTTSATRSRVGRVFDAVQAGFVLGRTL